MIYHFCVFVWYFLIILILGSCAGVITRNVIPLNVKHLRFPKKKSKYCYSLPVASGSPLLAAASTFQETIVQKKTMHMWGSLITIQHGQTTTPENKWQNKWKHNNFNNTMLVCTYILYISSSDLRSTRKLWFFSMFGKK